jgi:hypothetical protein
MREFSEWWRQISEYLPHWCRLTLLACIPMGEGLRDLCILIRPEWNIGGVSYWGWTIFAMFVALPVAYTVQLINRRLLGHDDYWERIRREIRDMKLAMNDVPLSKAEQRLVWRALFQRLAAEAPIARNAESASSSTTPDASA